jgi:hypothetical protein
MMKILEDRKLTVKTPYNGTVIIVPYRSGSREKVEAYFDFRSFVKKEHRKYIVSYLKEEGFVEKAIRE